VVRIVLVKFFGRVCRRKGKRRENPNRPNLNQSNLTRNLGTA
jgi:hypothetical protein